MSKKSVFSKMKRSLAFTLALILSIGIMATGATSLANEVDITADFTCPNFLAAVREIIEKPTGPIYTSDVAGITELRVIERNITSLAGIQHFSALTLLGAPLNQLTSLDVSNNPALEALYVGSNQLTSLNVSNNRALVELNVWSNQLTTLDLRNNPALRELDAGSNQLTTLDVSNNPALEYLAISNNRITSLNLSNNTRLTWLAAAINNLTSLDISRNTELFRLVAWGNRLTGLDVSNNSRLQALNIWGNNMTSVSAIVGVGNTRLPAVDTEHDMEGETADQRFFFFSPQRREIAVDLVERLYTYVLDREYDELGIAFWVNQIMTGNRTATDVARDIIFSIEYADFATTNTEFIEMLYRTLMGRPSDAAGMTHWLGQMGAGVTRMQVFNHFADSEEWYDLTWNFWLIAW